MVQYDGVCGLGIPSRNAGLVTGQQATPVLPRRPPRLSIAVNDGLPDLFVSSTVEPIPVRAPGFVSQARGDKSTMLTILLIVLVLLLLFGGGGSYYRGRRRRL